MARHDTMRFLYVNLSLNQDSLYISETLERIIRSNVPRDYDLAQLLNNFVGPRQVIRWPGARRAGAPGLSINRANHPFHALCRPVDRVLRDTPSLPPCTE